MKTFDTDSDADTDTDSDLILASDTLTMSNRTNIFVLRLDKKKRSCTTLKQISGRGDVLVFC